jgi:cell division protein FtsA
VKGLSDIVRNPIYSTGVGLLLYGLKQQQDRDFQTPPKDAQPGLMERFSAWLKKNL